MVNEIFTTQEEQRKAEKRVKTAALLLEQLKVCKNYDERALILSLLHTVRVGHWCNVIALCDDDASLKSFSIN